MELGSKRAGGVVGGGGGEEGRLCVLAHAKSIALWGPVDSDTREDACFLYFFNVSPIALLFVTLRCFVYCVCLSLWLV